MSKKAYDHIYIEKKWQKKWEEEKEFEVQVDKSKPKFYILDMFPYPSGSGLHVGHVTGYTATDIIARHKRQKGFNVLHPMGWDSFGLPAEQYAIRTGTHPAKTTKKNIDTYRRQLKSLGFSYDWSREVATSDPQYYKWTQWIFTKLFEKGLAYEAEILVNFCPKLGTTLANEEIEDGRSKIGGYPVERKPLRQWVLKITAYAEQLLKDLDDLDWPDYLKQLQRNWIGRSEGCKVQFAIEDSQEGLHCFTTCPDTIFGVSFLVVSPEHPIVQSLVKESQKETIEEYIEAIRSKSDLERTELNKDKKGVFTGSYAINPVSKQRIPIWIADYVLMGYGTGCVMGVPAHDERDFDFAKKYDLEIIPVIKAEDEETSRLNLEKEICFSGDGKCINSCIEGFSLNGIQNKKAKALVIDYLGQAGLGEKCVNYKLRDWLFSRQRYWGEPFPILHLDDGTKRVLDIDELPLTPPEVEDYLPSSDGQSPLAKCSNWVEVTDPKTGKQAKRETNTMPQWAGSCWYYLRFCDPHNTEQAWDLDIEKYWMPVDLYVGGVEHAVLHLLYARFWHKVLYDLKLVSTKEPFQTMRNQGLVTAKAYKIPEGPYLSQEEMEGEKAKGAQILEQVEKMSKSKLNGVTPDAIVEEFGADALRLYEMFMAPFDKEKLWNTDAVNGCYRFLKRIFEIVQSEKVTQDENIQALKLGAHLVKGVSEDIEKMHFNTAIAKMMEFINELTSLQSYPKETISHLIQMLYPFAPHFAEECWEMLGHNTRILQTPFPKVDEKYLEETEVTYIVQVNGKLRGKLNFPKGENQEVVLKGAEKEEKVKKFIDGEIIKVIFVPDRLLNIVVKKS